MWSVRPYMGDPQAVTLGAEASFNQLFGKEPHHYGHEP